MTLTYLPKIACAENLAVGHRHDVGASWAGPIRSRSDPLLKNCSSKFRVCR
jgi:hypothetical protein